MITIVVPVLNEEKNVDRLIEEVGRSLGPEAHELLFVDDGSNDGTADRVLRRRSEGAPVRLLSLSRRFGHQAALKAGLDHAEGDAVVTMDGDLQHPPRLLPALVAKWREGFDIVLTIRRETGSAGFLKRAASGLFYAVFRRLSETDLRPGAADFRLLDRSVVRELRKFNEAHLFLRGIIGWLGFRQAFVEYEADPRAQGQSKYTWGRMMALALDGVTGFSLRPLRVAGVLSLSVFCLACVYIAYALWTALVNKAVVSGWASLLITVLVMGSAQLASVWLLGEYIGKIFIESKKRPLYAVRERGPK